MMLLRYATWSVVIGTAMASLISSTPALLELLLPITTFSSGPFLHETFSKNRPAVAMSRRIVIRKRAEL
jgi:hypothetical protein